ncbi:MAG TPA: PKD domain-containing protein [Crocinitomix sp.]|nr:PKD domain-containing protein [Crocinitomix sp.]
MLNITLFDKIKNYAYLYNHKFLKNYFFMKKVILSIFTLSFVLTTQAQVYDSSRYLTTNIFPTTTAANNIQYGSAPQWVWPYWDEDLFLNITQPNGDANTKRPLIIFAHAGGFLNGSKDVDNMVAICDTFARMGFVTATIDYRKGFNPLDGASAERAVYRGIQDGKTAVRYFKTNANLYNIDTNYIFFGGMSAGGFMALYVAYMDKESERPSSTYGGGTVNDLGCLDCGDHAGVSSKVRGILDYWGAVDDTLVIESSTDTPVLIMHGENDPNVPFVYGPPFGLSTLSDVYGGQPIKERCDNLGVNNTFITSTGPLHMLDGSSNGDWNPVPNDFWGDTLLPQTTKFIYNLIKPNTQMISAQSQLICTGDNVSFEVTNDHVNSYFVWNYDNSNINILSTNINQQILQLEFNNAGNYQIKVVEFNEILCAGDTLIFDIQVEQTPTADFTFVPNGLDVSFTNTSSNGVTYTWDFGDGSTSTDMNPTHTYAQNGLYTVTLIATSANGCNSMVSSQQVDVTNVGLDELSQNFIYNNPFDYSINLLTDIPLVLVNIYSVSGQLMYSNQTNTNQLNIETTNWGSGLYILKYVDENNQNGTIKLIKL